MKRSTLITCFIALSMFLVAPTIEANDIVNTNEIPGGAYATFAGKFGGELSRKELDKTTELGIAGCAAGSTFIKYTMVIYQDGKGTRMNGTSNKLTKEMLKGIKNLKKGDTFEFINMRAKLPGGGKIDAVSKLYTVV